MGSTRVPLVVHQDVLLVSHQTTGGGGRGRLRVSPLGLRQVAYIMFENMTRIILKRMLTLAPARWLT